MSLSPCDVRLYLGEPWCDACKQGGDGWTVSGILTNCPRKAQPAPAKDAESPYSALRAILDAAYEQAAIGKGEQRHGNGKPWTEQPIFTVTRRHGIGFLTGQAEKKLGEAMGMIARGEHERARAELLGAIVYAAAAAHVCGEGRE